MVLVFIPPQMISCPFPIKEKPTGIFQAENNTDIIFNMQKTKHFIIKP